MDLIKSSFQKKRVLLRIKFLEGLSQRLNDSRKHLNNLQANHEDWETATQLHLLLHNIKGTSLSFGFNDLGEVAGYGEQLLTRTLSRQLDITNAWHYELDESLNKIETFAEAHYKTLIDPDQTDSFIEDKTTTYPELTNNTGPLVYICDDDRQQVELIANQLHCFGYRTGQFINTDDFCSAVRNEVPQAIIMDIMFPEGQDEGTMALNELHGEGYKFSVIFISGRNDFDARLNAIRVGGEAFFPKPVKPMDLVTVLDSLTQQSSNQPYRVLIVDDDEEVGQYHNLILEANGMITQVVLKPDTVLDAVNEFRPDLVLMDLYMPKCSGWEVAKLIRQIPDFISLPIVFLSSETDKIKQLSAMQVGADDFLIKPIQANDLIASITLRAERMRTLRGLMVRDGLTGLFNHSATTQFLGSAIDRARRQKSSLSFAMIDLDYFKLVNDTYGHLAGDQVLMALARVLRQRLRQSDIIGRYGGEEFAVILHDLSSDKAMQVMDQLRLDFSKVLFYSGDSTFSCTFSCGVASFSSNKSMDSLRESADKALYQAKHQGRNRVVSFV